MYFKVNSFRCGSYPWVSWILFQISNIFFINHHTHFCMSWQASDRCMDLTSAVASNHYIRLYSTTLYCIEYTAVTCTGLHYIALSCLNPSFRPHPLSALGCLPAIIIVALPHHHNQQSTSIRLEHKNFKAKQIGLSLFKNSATLEIVPASESSHNCVHRLIKQHKLI